MDELQAKLNRRLSRIDQMKSVPGTGKGDAGQGGDGASQAQFKEVFDLRSADRDTLLELINICATSLPPGG
jgi:hypothetical protein